MDEQTMNKQRIEDAVRNLLEAIGEDAGREGLKGTPDRVARMIGEIYRGYDPAQKPKVTTFPNGQDGIKYTGMICDTGTYYSMCEHHMMPFFGKYLFAYVPNENGLIVGISKVGRVVDYCAAKLQVQERLTQEVVNTILAELNDQLPSTMWAKGIALIMEGEHLCKSMRGVKKAGKMRTIYALGCLNTQEAKAELNAMFNAAR